MPVVSSLRERRGKTKVFLDGEFWAELDAGFVLERGLYEGVEIPEEELGELRVSGERAPAMNRALNLLGYRGRAAGEVRERLRRYGYSEGTVEVVVERLEELGYLDDREFARTAALEKSRKYGPRRIMADLRKGGVDEETAREATEAQFSEDSELQAAREAAQRRYNTRSSSGADSSAEARRVYGFLVRRGYSAGVCAEVAREYREDSLDESETGGAGEDPSGAADA